MIRPPTASDDAAIRELLDGAFAPSRYESRLRELVLSSGAPYWEWLLEQESRVVATILYTPATRDGAMIGYHLAPVAVHPEYQQQGLGSRLIRATLGYESIATGSVFVLGDPEFYERFGFMRTATAICPFDVGNAHFRALRFSDDCPPFEVGYAAAFAEA